MNVVIKLHCGPQDLDEYYHLIIGITIPSTQLSSANTQFPSQCGRAVVHVFEHTCYGVFSVCCIHCVIVFACLYIVYSYSRTSRNDTFASTKKNCSLSISDTIFFMLFIISLHQCYLKLFNACVIHEKLYSIKY